MSNLKDIKKRIKSVNSTSKVTHAMELVAAAKMRKSQEKTLASRPYTRTLHQMIVELKPETHKRLHPLLRTPKDGGPQLVILVTPDRGLVGGLNLNLMREASRMLAENKNLPAGRQVTKFITVGKKGLSFISKLNAEIIASFETEELSEIDLARTISKLATKLFISREIAGVWAIYPDFVSVVKQTPVVVRLLPIKLKEEEKSQESTDAHPIPSMLYEPSADKILKTILTHHVLTDIYQILLETKASEHSARMVAMKNATDAANDLTSSLTLTYNQARQEAITTELLDIVTAQSAFN